MSIMKRKPSPTFNRAFKDTLPVMAGYTVLGMGFGVLLATKGFNFLWASLMSGIIYAGSMQFVAVDLLSCGTAFLTCVLMTLLVNARHLFYGLSLIEKYNSSGKYRPYLIFSLTDETYSIVSSVRLSPEINRNRYYFFVSLLNHIYWIIGSTVGCIIGNSVSFNSMGIEFAMTALFVTIFTDQWLNSKEHSNALVGLGATLICRIVFGTSSFLVVSMAVILALLFILRPFLDKEEVQQDD